VHIDVVRAALSEIGGVIHIESIIDQQEGSMCGFEAVENVLQLYVPVDNSVSHTDLVARAHKYGALGWTGSSYFLDIAGYEPLLRDYGIGSRWTPFSHEALIDAVWSNRVAIVLVDGCQLDPESYSSPNSFHVVVVTNLVTDATRRTALAYVGIDSNFGGRQREWPLDLLARAAEACPHRSMLVTDAPARWPHRSAHYVQLPDKRIVPTAAG
jgi:hypothetical protein